MAAALEGARATKKRLRGGNTRIVHDTPADEGCPAECKLVES
jgi:hypothetical protein